MRRFFRSLLVATALAGLLVGPAAAAKPVPGETRPACADIVPFNDTDFSAGAYDGGTQTVRVQLALAAESCKSVTYTLVVLDAAGGAVLDLLAVKGDGTTDIITFEGLDASGNDDNIVCVYVTTDRGSKVIDRAPDETDAPDCNELDSGGTAGAGNKWN